MNLEFRIGMRRAGLLRFHAQLKVSLANGCLPVAISYRTAPKENRSVRASSSPPRTRSGGL